MRSTIILAAFTLFLVGCVGTQTFTLKQPAIPRPAETREGKLSVKVIDSRETTQKIGVISGGFGNKVADIVVGGDLETTIRKALTEALEKAGYTVVLDAKITMEGEIREFWLDGNGWTQHAKEKLRLRLRDKDGQILWEQNVSAEDGGMQGGIFSYEKSMNVAFERLLKAAMEEIDSEFFYQNVKKHQ